MEVYPEDLDETSFHSKYSVAANNNKTEKNKNKRSSSICANFDVVAQSINIESQN